MNYMIVNGWSLVSTFKTERGAKIALARKYRSELPEAVVMSEAAFAEHKKVEPMREVTNIMTGEKVLEPVSTPHYLSVSSETYWSQ